jgi:hypothetical protein
MPEPKICEAICENGHRCVFKKAIGKYCMNHYLSYKRRSDKKKDGKRNKHQGENK